MSQLFLHQSFTKIFFMLLLCGFQETWGHVITEADSANIKIKGIPRIIHYTKKEYNADSQFWAMCQDKEGILYFGNNDGVLVFDGERWQKITLPNNSSVRSLHHSTDGKVYAGGYNEFGLITRDHYGDYHFESLLDLLRQEDRNLENIWQIHETQGHIVLRSFFKLIAIAHEKAITLPSSNYFSYSTVIDNQLYVVDGEGLKSLDLPSREFTLIFRNEEINQEEVTAILPGFQEGELLAITKQGTSYKIDLQQKKVEFWERIIPKNSNNLITCALKSTHDTYYLGTLSSKVITLNQAGRQIVTNEAFQNLQDNTVLGLCETDEGNIWALLNKGIDCIDIVSPVSLIFEEASIFDVLIDEDEVYLATNQGVFVATSVNKRSNLSSSNFEKVSGLEGQAWSFQQFKGKVFCSHDRGLFVFSERGIHRVSGITGVWKVISLKSRPDDFLVCTYDGIFLLHYESSGKFVLKHRIEGFNESGRDILQSEEPEVFWVCHGYKGVFRIKVDTSYTRVVSLEHFEDKNGLPSPFNINVFRWSEEIVFTTNQGIYTYHPASNQFQPHAHLTNLFGKERNVRKLLQYQDKTWFIHDDEAGYFVTNEPHPVLKKDLFMLLKGSFNRGLECIIPLSSQQVLIGTNTGLYAFDLEKDVSRQSAQTIFTGISYKRASEEIACPLPSLLGAPPQLPNKINGIRFSFAAPGFQNKMNVQYSYWLEGVNDGWSDWEYAAFKEYAVLPPGKYTFHIKAKSLLGERAPEIGYVFEILPRWYQTAWAISVFCLLMIIIITVIVIWVNRKIRYEKEKTRDEEKKMQKVLELEIQRIKLEREKEIIKKDKEQLEEDVIYKSKELANYMVLLVKKRELLIEINEELKSLRPFAHNENSRNKLRELIKKININLLDEEHIRVFEANFERVHHEFFNELKTNFPDLTQKELRLCAFVKMNLTNKEIASILNISVRGVETARYRLRKRLSLDYEENMVEFLEKLSQAFVNQEHS